MNAPLSAQGNGYDGLDGHSSMTWGDDFTVLVCRRRRSRRLMRIGPRLVWLLLLLALLPGRWPALVVEGPWQTVAAAYAPCAAPTQGRYCARVGIASAASRWQATYFSLLDDLVFLARPVLRLSQPVVTRNALTCFGATVAFSEHVACIQGCPLVPGGWVGYPKIASMAFPCASMKADYQAKGSLEATA